MAKDKIPFEWRTFPHANSARKLADRYDDDRAEAIEYTDDFQPNRNGHKNIPDIYDDELTAGSGKYKTKPKKHNHKGQDTIRKVKEEEQDE